MALLRNFATVGVATMASRVLGFVRDIFLAAAVGTGFVADAFVVAQRFPNLFRRIFAEGAFNAAFIPLFAKELEGRDAAAAKRFAEEAMAGLAFVLLLLTALAEIAMPWLMLGLAPGFSGDPEKFDLAVLLTRIAFPYLFLVSISALLAGVLNALRRFAAAAFAPALLNVALIAALLVIHWQGLIETREAGIILAWGVTAGGVLQILLLLFALRHEGFTLRLVRPRWTPGMKRLVQLGIPGVLAGGIVQFNIVIGTIIASMQEGAVSYLYYADRLYQLPLGVVGVAIGVVLLPELSRRLKAGDQGAVEHTQNRSIEFAMLLTLPAALALALVPGPIVQVLFERGAFDAHATRQTALALGAFAIGLPAFVLVKLLQPGFFAREDTKTPMHYAGAAMVVNVVFSLALFPVIGHVGIALATTLSGWVNAGLLGWMLARRGHLRADRPLASRLARIAVASIAMGLGLILALWVLSPLLARGASFAAQGTGLALLCGFGAVVYFAMTFALGVIKPSELRGLLTRRRAA